MTAVRSLFEAGFIAPHKIGCCSLKCQTLQFGVSRYTKLLRVCHDNDQATYRFGTANATELEIAVPLTRLDYKPWPGIGRAIAEDVVFRNGAYAYEVYVGFDRMLENKDVTRHFGGVRVTRGDAEVASLVCRPDSVNFSWSPALFEAMQAAGLVWDHDTRRWGPRP